MRISTLLYTCKQGFKNIFRNKMFSLATVATISSCVFLFGIFYSLVVNIQSSVKAAESNIAVTVFFDENLDLSQIQAIGEEIAKRPEVASMVFVSADEAWESFKYDYLGEYADGYEGDNPLEGSEHFEIYMNDVAQQNALVSYLETVDGIRDINRSDTTASILSNINMVISYVSLAIIGILLAVSLFLISNTVAMGIAVRREEIAIMKLIGAKDTFVRQPFIVEGIAIGLIGSVVPLLLLHMVYGGIIKYVSENFHLISSLMDFVPVNDVFSVLVPVSLILGVGIGFVGSRITLKRHLKV